MVHRRGPRAVVQALHQHVTATPSILVMLHREQDHHSTRRPRGEPKEEKPRSEFCRYTGINLLQWQRWPLLGLHVISDLLIVPFSASIGLLSAFILCPTKKIRSSAIMALSLRSAEDASPATTPYELSFFNQW
nr:uncharacterized protein LOC127334717 isoform X3 [Lolium perenne]